MALPNSIKLLETISACRAFRHQYRAHAIALVPTMGALHKGHRALIRQAKQLVGHDQPGQVIVSIFVNPLQFGPNEDFNRYPRTLEADLEACRTEGADAVFLPTPTIMYPTGMADIHQVVPPLSLTEKLCGAQRPGHFTGVTTVVCKLFNIIQPDLAIFGEKDAQQLAIIQAMTRDLNLPVQVVPHPIVREPDGLAFSSRNQYLITPESRQAARMLSQILQASVNHQPGINKQNVFTQAVQSVTQAQPSEVANLFQLEYLEAVDLENFQPVDTLQSGVRVFIAANVAGVRLIDNQMIIERL